MFFEVECVETKEIVVINIKNISHVFTDSNAIVMKGVTRNSNSIIKVTKESMNELLNHIIH